MKRTLSVACVMGAVVLFRGAVARAGDDFQSWTLKHVEPTEARRLLRDLLDDDDQATVRILADNELNELAVRGPAAVRRLTEQLVRQIDRPSKPPAEHEQERRILRACSVGDADPVVVRQRVIDLLGDRVRVSVDETSRLLWILAAPEDHTRITRMLSSADRPVSSWRPAVRPDHGASAPAEAVSSETAMSLDRSGVKKNSPARVRRVHSLRHITVEQCRRAIRRLLKQKVDVLPDGRLKCTVDETGPVILSFDSGAQACTVSGRPDAVDSLVSLIRWLERSQAPDRTASVRFVSLKNVRPDVLDRALRLWRSAARRSPKSSPEDNTQSAVRHRGAIRPVGFQQTAPAAADVPAAADTADAPRNSEADPGGAADDAASDAEDELRPPLSGVSVQPFPGLDVLAVQGKDADVEELIRIIREIERLSDEARPEVEIVHLKNVDSTTLDSFIDTILNALTEPLQGRVGITPVEKPNALLLIGWGEAVAAAKDLIEKLDQPVTPDQGLRIFTLKNTGPSEILGPLQNALSRRGGLAPQASVTASPRTNSLIVYAAPRDMAEIERLIEHLDAESSGTTSKGRIVRLKNALAEDVAAMVTAAITAAAGGGDGRRSAELDLLLVQPDGREIVASGILNGVKIVPNPRLNTLFITGPEKSLSLVERLIEELDRSPAASAVIKVFEISNGNASDLVSVLRSLFPATAVGSGVPPLATAEGESSLVPVRFSVDVRTNTIIATGTQADLQVMEALLVRLDGVASQERVTDVYHPRNSPADAIADAVNEYLRSERVVHQAAPGRMNPFEQIQQEVVVVAETTRNQLIISATPRFFDRIMELVQDLDSKPPQVMIQVILAEVDLDTFHEVGVELGIQDSLLFDRSLLGDLITTTTTSSVSTPTGIVTTTQDNIIAASNTPGFNFNNNPLGNSGSNRSLATAGNVAGQGLSHFNVGRTNADLGYGGLVLSASSENVSVLLRALDRSGSMEILSRPQIMTLDNTEAFIQVGESVPRISSSQVNQLGQINSLEDTEVGLLLGVIPRINPDGTVVMEVDATKSEVGPEAEGIPVFVSTDGTVVRSPRVNITTTRTTVSAASGQTVVIGGLITTSNVTDQRKVPWLGDLPVLGKFFRYDMYRNQRTELLIILTPHVILGQEDAEYQKQVEMARMSWVSSDIFEFLDSGSAACQVQDQHGVEVIYPDDTPAVPRPPADVPDVPESSSEPPPFMLPQEGESLPQQQEPQPLSSAGEESVLVPVKMETAEETGEKESSSGTSGGNDLRAAPDTPSRTTGKQRRRNWFRFGRRKQ